MLVVGYTVGVYDLFNVGHVRQLAAARALCTRLVVGVLDDGEVERRYGGRPFVPISERITLLGSLDCVHDVVVAAGPGNRGGRMGRAAVPSPRSADFGPRASVWWAPPEPIEADLVILGTDPHAPLSTPLTEAVAGSVPVVRLADVPGTASTILRAALARSSVA